jgi:hypothetical protein
VRKLACAFGCVSIASEKAKAAASCRTPRRPSGAASQKVCGIRRLARMDKEIAADEVMAAEFRHVSAVSGRLCALRHAFGLESIHPIF